VPVPGERACRWQTGLRQRKAEFFSQMNSLWKELKIFPKMWKGWGIAMWRLAPAPLKSWKSNFRHSFPEFWWMRPVLERGCFGKIRRL